MNIVALDGYLIDPSAELWSLVRPLGNFTLYDRTDSTETLERCATAEIVLTNKVMMDQAVIAQLPQLKMIGVTATGYNVVDVEFARSQGIVVTNVPEYSTDSVAQHVFASLLGFLHRPESHHAAVANGDWIRSSDFAFWLSPLTELSGKTFGVVGLGKIGRATAKLAAAFGMKVIANSRRESDPLDLPGFAWKSTEEIFSESDVVSLHCPQTPETEGFVNSELIAKMRSDSILINTARGGLVNEFDLTKALNADQIRGAILDVVSVEPMRADNPLLRAKNCLITPHIAWTTIEARARLTQTVADNIAAFQGGKPINVVN
ncbi:MAG: D-2-hydroxyacid dehydrogenase [Mariniblastus sp.]|nr:D-2-hydroxyacid dehydrogenase [Mariniblastus sp.]